ncbi:hypothetical protein WN55_09550 [Dufourea novaeangliae]|uniref:Uncharacterized protein n=1 Tax=Dufourea novaeangliae TaxID=178035 RepID=A0A154NYT8_DUFNO|nr:hypothetical protein WN55_09550 [Dufourea novaeangliae]
MIFSEKQGPVQEQKSYSTHSPYLFIANRPLLLFTAQFVDTPHNYPLLGYVTSYRTPLKFGSFEDIGSVISRLDEQNKSCRVTGHEARGGIGHICVTVTR